VSPADHIVLYASIFRTFSNKKGAPACIDKTSYAFTGFHTGIGRNP
jgi:hypothetical protein